MSGFSQLMITKTKTHTVVFLLYFIIHQWMVPNLGTLQCLVLDTREAKEEYGPNARNFASKQKANLKTKNYKKLSLRKWLKIKKAEDTGLPNSNINYLLSLA